MMKRISLVAALGAVLLLTTACGPIAGPTASPTDGSSSAPTSETPTATPTPSPIAAATLTAGDCTRAEMQDAIPTIYTIYTDDSTNPLTIHYTAFNHDGTTPTQTLTTVGPVITIVGYDCSDPSAGGVWTLTATHNTIGSIGCVLAFGGLIVRQDSAGQEDPSASIDCSGNPGM